LLYNSDSSLSLRAYSNVGWADYLDTRCFTTAFCIFLGSSHSWCSKHQNVVSHSSTEAEYRAMVDIPLALRWLCDHHCDMGVSVSAPIPMHCDNKSAIAITSDHVFHDCTKYIEVDCHITHHEYEKGKITLSYIPSGAQLADLFTTAQTSSQFREILSKLSAFDSL